MLRVIWVRYVPEMNVSYAWMRRFIARAGVICSEIRHFPALSSCEAFPFISGSSSAGYMSEGVPRGHG